MFISEGSETNPIGADNTDKPYLKERVNRGDGYSSYASFCTVGSRNRCVPELARMMFNVYAMGFRIACYK